LSELGNNSGLIGTIFGTARNLIQDPTKLQLLIKLIDEEKWHGLDIDVKGEIYEGLLEKNAQDVKSGAGQYFTPRPLIRAIVEVMQPQPGQAICDPACGTGGFLLAAYDYIIKHHDLNQDQIDHLRSDALQGWEIVEDAARLCVMNLFLHGIGVESSTTPIHVGDSLSADPGNRFDMVLSNPPFGKSSSLTYVTDSREVKNGQTILRDDFWTSASNKQVNFLQHIYTILADEGKAAVIVPDNVLFEGGAGEAVRRKLLRECDVHTLLRLPKGIFYAHAVNANILFFDKKPKQPGAWTKQVWVYDLRTNKNFTLKRNPLTFADLNDFIACFRVDNRLNRQATWSDENPEGRWRFFTYDEILARDKASLDLLWLRDESFDNEKKLSPQVIAAEIIADLETALEQFQLIVDDLASIAH
jgi:type I restriction enzyme M protein